MRVQHFNPQKRGAHCYPRRGLYLAAHYPFLFPEYSRSVKNNYKKTSRSSGAA